MERKLFFEKIKESYFEDLACKFDDFKSMVLGAMPVFGELEIDITKKGDGLSIVFRDISQAMFAIGPKGYEPTDSDMDMTSTVMKLTLNEANRIVLVEHGVGLLTPANKDTILFLGSLVGKIILL